MRARRSKSSISLPIVLSVITVLLSISLLVMWTLVILQNTAMTRQVVQNTWILVIGIVSLVVIITVVVLMSVFLVREILEVRRQDSFIASVTHELKSPLASLKLCLDTMARSDLRPEHGRQLRQMMTDDVERLALFIDDILEASRLPAWGRGHDIREVRLRPLVQRCVRTIVARYKLDGGQIHVEVGSEIHVSTDPTALETVLKNLLDNAVKYSDPPACVRVACPPFRDKRRLCIEVSDHGIGIPAPQLRRVFERFYRVPVEAVRARRGTGLGLYVVAALVRSLGGRLEARSDGVGCGTTMRVLLPSHKTQATEPQPV